MQISPQELGAFADEAYALTREQRGLSRAEDLSNDRLCSLLSRNLHTLLSEAGFEARRELHITDKGSLHFLVTHSAPGRAPSPNDFISDLNPWQFGPETLEIGALHGRRSDVQETLRTKGAPEWFIGLRGISTIYEAHSVRKRRPAFFRFRRKPPIVQHDPEQDSYELAI